MSRFILSATDCRTLHSPMATSLSAPMSWNLRLRLRLKVTNTGNYDAAEVVQLYIRDMVGSISRPVKELKGFERIFLKKGESRDVTFEINADLLKFYNSSLEYVCEPGEFRVMVGCDSKNVQTKTFTLKE